MILRVVFLLFIMIIESSMFAQPFTFKEEYSSYSLGVPQFGTPTAIELDVDTGFFLMDSQTSTVLKYDKDGNFLFRFGGIGDDEGRLKAGGMISLRNGFVYVASEGRINKFTRQGKFVSRIGTFGDKLGEINGTPFFDVDSMGNHYTVTQNDINVQRFDSTGKEVPFVPPFIYRKPNETYSVSLGRGVLLHNNFFYVTEDRTERLVKFNSDGSVFRIMAYSYRDNSHPFRDQVTGIYRIHIRGNKLYASDFFENERTMMIYDLSKNLKAKKVKAPINNEVFSGQVPDFVPIGNGDYYMVSSTNHCVYLVDTTLTVIKKKLACGYKATLPGQFWYPIYLAKDNAQNLVVVDKNNQRFQIINTQTKSITSVGKLGIGNNQFLSPVGISYDSNNNYYVIDQGSYEVKKFNQMGEFLLSFGKRGVQNGDFIKPVEVFVNSKNEVLVADFERDDIQVFSASGQYLRTYGSQGSNNGEFSGVLAMKTDKHENIYVLESTNNRIQIFNSNGEYKRQISLNGITTEPRGLWINDYVYVTDRATHKVIKLNLEGEKLAEFGGMGSETYQFYNPEGIFVDDSNYVFVADAGNNRIMRYYDALPKPTVYRFEGGSVFPNPFTEQLIVSPDASLQGVFNLIVSSMDGRVVYSEQVNQSNTSNGYVINAANFQVGAYILTVTDNKTFISNYKIAKVE